MNAATATFSLPLVASDFSSFLANGFVFRTHRALVLTLERLGQNFVLLRWAARIEDGEEATAAAQADIEHDLFEVEVVEVDTEETKLLRHQGSYMLVRHLRPDSTVKCQVRWVAKQSDFLASGATRLSHICSP